MFKEPSTGLVKEYEAKIEELNDSFIKSVNLVMKIVQLKLVNPFCKKYRVSFWSGMGGYGFKTRQGHDLNDYYTIPSGMPNAGTFPCVLRRYAKTKPGKELAEILKVLELKGYPTDACPIGAYMNDFDGTRK
jgi:hypothetical protein